MTAIPMGMRTRLWLAAALPAVLAVMTLLGVFLHRHDSERTGALTDRARASASQLGGAADFPLFAGNRYALQRLVDSALAGDPQMRGAAVFANDGQRFALAGSLSDSLPAFGAREQIVVGQRLVVVTPIVLTSLAKENLFAQGPPAGLPVQGSGVLGYAVVELSLEALKVQQRDLLTWSLATMVGVLLLAGFLSIWIASGVTQPIGVISRIVARIREGDMTARVDESQAGVLEVLATGINEMAVKVALTQEHLRQQVALATEELLRQKEAAEQLARVDHLTGAASRGAFMEVAAAEVQRSLRYNQPLCMVAIDLDHFKGINDTHGHAAGDAVLVHFARTLEGEVREVDLIGRLGGEEFAVLLPNIAAGEAMQVAERMRHAVSVSRLESGGRPVRYSASFGVAQFDPRELTLASLLSRADTALYDAKRRGRDRVELAA